jgi:hypothetical protein
MASDSIGRDGDKVPCGDKNKSNDHGGLTIFITQDTHTNTKPPNTHSEAKDQPNWVEKWTLVVLFLAFIAATYAGYEANRLADLTQIVIDDAAKVSKQQAQDTTTALGLSKQSADAAASAVETNIATERARLFLGNVFFKGDREDPYPIISFQIINLGKTSALVIGVSYECSIISPNIDINPTCDPKRLRLAMNVVSSGSIFTPPVGQECTFDRDVIKEDYVGLSTKSKIILFKGFVRFKDIFSNTFTKRFGVYGYGATETEFFPIANADGYNIEIKDQ